MNTSTCEELGTCKDSDGPNPLLVLPVLLSVLWVLFDLFYASSLVAFVVNRLANFFLKESGIYIGRQCLADEFRPVGVGIYWNKILRAQISADQDHHAT